MYGARVLDLGSGGGFPGIPLGVVRSDLKLTLLDSIRKKTTALEYIIQGLGLRNISVVTARAEELVRQRNHRFDIVVARGVASLTDLINWSKPLMARQVHNQKYSESKAAQVQKKIDTPSLLALKGGDLEKEVQTAKRKTGEQKIITRNLVFEGSQEVGLEGKKLVIVEF
jgi:16S rRNA (guanine527-N7)-methyltransferase